MNVLVFQRLALEFFLHLVFFPVWWYTKGAKKVLLSLASFWQEVNITLAPGLWLKNIFVPMFGQHDFQGRLTSFIVRSMNVVIRSCALAIFSVFLLGVYCLWLLLPAITVYMLAIALF